MKKASLSISFKMHFLSRKLLNIIILLITLSLTIILVLLNYFNIQTFSKAGNLTKTKNQLINNYDLNKL